MRSKILLTLYSIVHGPEKQNKKTLKDHILKKGTKLQPTCKTKPKRKKKNKHLRCIHSYAETCIRSRFTKLPYVQILQNSISGLDNIILSRKDQHTILFYFFRSASQSNSK